MAGLTYANVEVLTLFADGRPSAITAWCREHLISPAIHQDFLHEISAATANMVRRVVDRDPNLSPLQPDATWGFVPVGNVDPAEVVALQMLSAAINGDHDILHALIHTVIARGRTEPVWVALVTGECILLAGNWVRALRESVST